MLAINPRAELDPMVLGEECVFELDTTEELGTKTIHAYTYKIYNSLGNEEPSLNGGSSVSSGIIAFGIKAAIIGKYTIKFIVTCNEVLPDGITPYEFYCVLTVVIR